MPEVVLELHAALAVGAGAAPGLAGGRYRGRRRRLLQLFGYALQDGRLPFVAIIAFARPRASLHSTPAASLQETIDYPWLTKAGGQTGLPALKGRARSPSQ